MCQFVLENKLYRLLILVIDCYTLVFNINAAVGSSRRSVFAANGFAVLILYVYGVKFNISTERLADFRNLLLLVGKPRFALTCISPILN